MRISKHHDAIRTFFVAAVAAFALGTSIPNLYYTVYPMYGTFGFQTDENNVVGFALPQAIKAGIRIGDRVNYAAMPVNDHYQERFPLINRMVTFRLQRGNAEHSVSLTAWYNRRAWIWPLWSLVIRRTIALVLVIVASALVLLRPAPLSRAFFLYAVGTTHAVPYFYSFMPMGGYFSVMAAFDGLWSVGVASFVWIALNLGSLRRARWATVVPLGIFVILFFTLLIPDINLMLLGRAAGPLLAFSGNICSGCYLVGTVTLVLTALRRALPGGERLAAAFMAIAGLALLIGFGVGYVPFDWQNSTFAARIAFKNINETIVILNAIANLIVAYIIIRMRVIDVGLVTSRILWYGAIAFTFVAALAFVNWAYAAQLAAFPFAIPFEVIAAVAIGYRFSGFRDVANALSLALDAENAIAEGRATDEHDALARAIGLAERTRQWGLIAEIRARCAFATWLAGDDDAFRLHVERLRRTLAGRSLRGISTFLAAADGSQYLGQPQVAEWAVRAALIMCGATQDALLAQRHARSALRFADESQLPWLCILALVAVAETAPSERSQLLERALNLARNQGWLALGKSLAALRSDAGELGLLEPFVLVRLRKVRPAKPALEVSFFTGTVRAYGEPVNLRDKEMELLFTVASERSGLRDDELMDRLWPEADGDAARNAFKVCLHRLRKDFGNPLVVRRTGKVYALLPGATVDLWELRDTSKACLKQREYERLDHLQRLYSLLCDGSKDRARLGAWFASFERQLERATHESEKILFSGSGAMLHSVEPLRAPPE